MWQLLNDVLTPLEEVFPEIIVAESDDSENTEESAEMSLGDYRINCKLAIVGKLTLKVNIDQPNFGWRAGGLRAWHRGIVFIPMVKWWNMSIDTAGVRRKKSAAALRNSRL